MGLRPQDHCPASRIHAAGLVSVPEHKEGSQVTVASTVFMCGPERGWRLEKSWVRARRHRLAAPLGRYFVDPLAMHLGCHRKRRLAECKHDLLWWLLVVSAASWFRCGNPFPSSPHDPFSRFVSSPIERSLQAVPSGSFILLYSTHPSSHISLLICKLCKVTRSQGQVVSSTLLASLRR